MTSLNLRPTDCDEFDAIKCHIRQLAERCFVPELGAAQQSGERWSTFKTHVLDEIPLFLDAPPAAYECLYQYVAKFLAARKHAYKRQEQLQCTANRLDAGLVDCSEVVRDSPTPRTLYRPYRTRSQTKDAGSFRVPLREPSPVSAGRAGEEEHNLRGSISPETSVDTFATRRNNVSPLNSSTPTLRDHGRIVDEETRPTSCSPCGLSVTAVASSHTTTHSGSASSHTTTHSGYASSHSTFPGNHGERSLEDHSERCTTESKRADRKSVV